MSRVSVGAYTHVEVLYMRCTDLILGSQHTLNREGDVVVFVLPNSLMVGWLSSNDSDHRGMQSAILRSAIRLANALIIRDICRRYKDDLKVNAHVDS